MTSASTFSNALRRAWGDLILALCVLNRIQFSAPWLKRQRGC